MVRYFIELAYRGDAYSGFQVQQNANSIQAEVEKALEVYFRERFELTGSSRTDAGVHARQNYFHFDAREELGADWDRVVYNLNAILPDDIVIKRVFRVGNASHCRFDAVSRRYEYRIHRLKDPFIADTAFYFPYTLDVQKLNAAAAILHEFTDFEAFSKRNTQVNHFQCTIISSSWEERHDMLLYTVCANRFLRGMVKGLVGTMLRVGRGKMSVEEFRGVISSKQAAMVDFSVPSRGLTLMAVEFDTSRLITNPNE